MKNVTKLPLQKWLLFLSLTLLILSCKKEINQKASPEEILSNSHHESEPSRVSARMAIDWYDLHLRMILHSKPFVSNVAIIRTFGYTGISLYEAVRFINPHSLTMAGKVYLMPSMPSPDNSKIYSWP